MKKIYKLTLVLVLAIVSPLALQAQQQMNVSGKVTDNTTGDPIAGVNVVIKGTSQGTITDIEGNYSISANSGATLLFSFIGFLTEEVVVSSATLNISMSEDVTSLEEIVISGLASGVKRSNSANAVASIDGEALAGKTGIQTLDAGLQGKIVGANILSNSGAPGGGVSMKLRGITTVTGSSEPLYIVDGVYFDNSVNQPATNTVTAAGGGLPASNQDNGANRIADLDPSDIESVEILKGASASAIYGSRANAGVVIITTKRGSTGKTNITFGQDFGTAKILNPLGIRPFTSASVLADFGATAQSQFDAAKAAGKLYNYEDEMYGETGLLLNSRLTLSGGTDKTKFFIAASSKDEEGIIKNTGFKRQSVRANIDHKISDMFDFNISTNYIKSQTNRGVTNNDNAGVSYGVALSATLPWHDLYPNAQGIYPDHPANPSNPLQTRDKSEIGDVTNRFVIGTGLNVNLMNKSNSFLQVKLTGGLDYYNNESTLYFPEFLQFTIGNQDGLYSRGNNVTFNTNHSAFLVYNVNVGSVNLTSSAGYNSINQNRELLTVQAQQLVSGQANLEQAGSLTVFNRKLAAEDFGYAIQQEANWDDKLIGTASVRFDKSTLNGDPNKMYAFPKVSLAANIANFDFWSFTQVNQLKLRAAYGEAGGVPNPNSTTLAQPQFTSLGSLNTGGLTGSVVGNTQGDPDIQPERSKELELGLDLGLFSNRVSLAATWYNKKVEDLILQASLPPTSGFTTQVTNLADLENRGVELSLDATVIKNSKVTWNSILNWWTNESEVTRLDIPAFNPPGGGFGTGLGTIRIEEGKSLTQIVGTNGSSTPEVLGNTAPDWEMSWNNSITFLKNFSFSMLWHWKKGGQNVNLTGLLTDFGGSTYNYDDILADGSRLGDARIAAFFSGENAAIFVEDSEYLKLRELSLYYSIPRSVLSTAFNGTLQKVRVGVSGNNLLLFSDYTSYDPEVSNFGSGGVLGGVEVTPFPSSKRMFFHLEIGF
ncbi:SusC/RagA family TonB-linked outer membrane protein [Fulvivirga sp.]|uniref:SusC/RagA family TonB-linked outer membrane protein n=1 Tax=Fulvivirga sp. TaxID=1931237 RepID=UPI0032EB158A